MTTSLGTASAPAVPSSTTFGTNFTTPGAANGTLVTDPFPANASGARFNAPIGNAAGALYYLGGGPSIYQHSITPDRQQRGTIGAQIQFGASTMLDVNFNIARTSHLAMGKSSASRPSRSTLADSSQFGPNALLNSHRQSFPAREFQRRRYHQSRGIQHHVTQQLLHVGEDQCFESGPRLSAIQQLQPN